MRLYLYAESQNGGRILGLLSLFPFFPFSFEGGNCRVLIRERSQVNGNPRGRMGTKRKRALLLAPGMDLKLDLKRSY